MALSPQWLDELRARTTLSAIVQRSVKLQRAGREWRACCPFHDEKTPSFYVNDAKGFYHCFGCQAHGDAISWLTDQQGLPFMDAVKELAALAGMEIPAPDPVQAKRAEKRAGLHDVTAAAQGWFEAMLRSDAGAKAREYLASRGWSQNTCKRFGFGYAPDTKEGIALSLKDIPASMLEQAGLRIKVDGRDPYDRFRDRLMLPIEDARGRVIAFGGRILTASKTDAPKYLNSPDTELFDKGRVLYNLHRAAPAARKAERIVVVEGYMDVIALADAGLEEAVAPLGTALTEMQMELLWRQVDAPILCFDGDAAGQRAAMRAATRALPLLQPGRTLRFVTMPDGMDPDDLLKHKGRPALDALLNNPRGLLETLWLAERDAKPLSTPEDKAGLKARLMDHVDTIAHPDIKSLYRRDLLDLFGAFAYPPREKTAGGKSWQPRGKRNDKPFQGPLGRPEAGYLKRLAATGNRDQLAAAVLAGLARHPDALADHAEPLLAVSEPGSAFARAIDALIEAIEMLEPGDTLPISARQHLAPLPDNTRYSFLMESTDPVIAKEDLAEAVALLVERPALEAAIAQATQRLEREFDDEAFEEQQRLRKRKLEFDRRLRQMASRRAAAAAQRN